MSELSAAGRVALDYAFAFPGTPTLTLAKQLFKLRQELFTCVELSRRLLRPFCQ